MSKLIDGLKALQGFIDVMGNESDAEVIRDTIMLISTLQPTNDALRAKIDGGL